MFWGHFLQSFPLSLETTLVLVSLIPRNNACSRIEALDIYYKQKVLRKSRLLHSFSTPCDLPKNFFIQFCLRFFVMETLLRVLRVNSLIIFGPGELMRHFSIFVKRPIFFGTVRLFSKKFLYGQSALSLS